MPVNECTSDGLPGVKWGEAGACYTYTPNDEESRKDAVRKALAQGIAIGDIDIERGLRSSDLEQRAPEDVDLTPTEEIAAAARKGLRLYEEGKGGDGLVEETIADARRMAAREPLSEEKVRRMPAWWARHSEDWTEADTEPGEETPGYVAALLWGIDALDGSPGATWAERKVAELDREYADQEAAEDRASERDADWMTPRQSAIYETLEQITDVFGAFDKTTGPDGIHYISADDNPFKEDGLVCAACAFYKGGGVCELLAEEDIVEAEGVCKFWIVPADRPGPDDTNDPAEEPDMVPQNDDELLTERSHSPVPVEYRDSGAGTQYKTITGYAAVWNKMSEDLGGFREILAPGAFTRALERGNTIKLLYDHDSAAVLASTQNGTLELREDEVGLHIWARVDMSDPDVQRVAAKLRSGIVDQMSFAFSMDEDSDESWDYKGGIPIRTIRSVSSLWETSVVSMPAYTSTKVALLERAKQIGRLPELVGATVVAPHGVGEQSPIRSQDRDTDAMRAAYWRAQLTKRKQETSKWTRS